MTLPQRPQLHPLTLKALEDIDAAEPDRHHETAPPAEPAEYGTPAWHQLDDHNPAKLAAVFEAADRWNKLLDSPYAAEVLGALYDWEDRRIYSEWGDSVSRLVREMGIEPGPSYDEIERRRTQPGLAAETWRHRHGSEHHGGPVRFSPTDGDRVQIKGAA